MTNALVYKLLGALALVAAFLFLAQSRASWKDKAEARQEQIEQTCAAVRLAADNPKLDCAKVNEQIAIMGRALDQAEQAAVESKRKNEADVARITEQGEAITERVKDDYEDDLARLRAELGSVRRQSPAAGNQGRNGGSQASAVPNAASQPDGKTVPIPASDLLFAAETELQLKHLQDWIIAQQAVAR